MFNLKGRNVVVSGASSGLGAQMALEIEKKMWKSRHSSQLRWLC